MILIRVSSLIKLNHTQAWDDVLQTKRIGYMSAFTYSLSGGAS